MFLLDIEPEERPGYAHRCHGLPCIVPDGRTNAQCSHLMFLVVPSPTLASDLHKLLFERLTVTKRVRGEGLEIHLAKVGCELALIHIAEQDFDDGGTVQGNGLSHP